MGLGQKPGLGQGDKALGYKTGPVQNLFLGEDGGKTDPDQNQAQVKKNEQAIVLPFLFKDPKLSFVISLLCHRPSTPAHRASFFQSSFFIICSDDH